MKESGQRTVWGAYKQVAAELTGRIADGRLPAGGPVPSEAALGREFGVSRTTVRWALAVEEKAGLVRAAPGAGRAVNRF
ncbi:GntR family transcriptional regulator [Nocardiopsis sp. NPDC101807]|uniref:GntR family transcriptional regulator n=1 Tax=Nocardiopsis sp. NPDC101807 TaxID=3364339 RepID=UPI003808EE8D